MAFNPPSLLFNQLITLKRENRSIFFSLLLNKIAEGQRINHNLLKIYYQCICWKSDDKFFQFIFLITVAPVDCFIEILLLKSHLKWLLNRLLLVPFFFVTLFDISDVLFVGLYLNNR